MQASPVYQWIDSKVDSQAIQTINSIREEVNSIWKKNYDSGKSIREEGIIFNMQVGESSESMV